MREACPQTNDVAGFDDDVVGQEDMLQFGVIDQRTSLSEMGFEIDHDTTTLDARLGHAGDAQAFGTAWLLLRPGLGTAVDQRTGDILASPEAVVVAGFFTPVLIAVEKLPDVGQAVPMRRILQRQHGQIVADHVGRDRVVSLHRIVHVRQHDAQSAEEYALRLGLRLAAGLSEEEGRLVAKVRRAGNGSPYGSVQEVARRAGISRRAIEALAEADAFASLGATRRDAIWEAKAIERDVPPLLLLAGAAASLGEPALIRESPALLSAEADGQSTVLDYMATGLTLRQHPLALLRGELQRLGMHDTRRLGTARPGSWIKVPGLVLMRQRPGTAKGIVFITIEDEFGTANLVVYTDIGARDRAAMIGARLLVAEGRVERETEHAEVPITHLICRKLVDRSDLLNGLMKSDIAGQWGDTALLRGDEVRRPEPGSARSKTKMPESRDFR